MTEQITWDSATLERFWAFHSKTPQNYFSYSKSADVVRRASAYLGPKTRVLDYGCGPGFMFPHLLRAGCDVWGGEFTEAVVGEPAKSISQPNFHGVHTIKDLVGRQQFDAITLLEVIEHLEDAPLQEVMANIEGLLAPNGALIVTTPNDENLEDSIVYCPVSDITFHRWQHVRTWSQATLTDYLSRRGFKIEIALQVNFKDEHDKSSLLRRTARTAIDALRKKSGLLVIARKR
jgi:2-polyprenyl-3-methyl-5-hydroxy-6-metoxy-1,4-benzoquinol methylase